MLTDDDDGVGTFGQVMGVDVDDIAPDGLRGDQRERQVLVLRVDRQVLFVDGSLVYRVGARVVYHFAVTYNILVFES